MSFAKKVTKILPYTTLAQCGCFLLLFFFAMVGVAVALSLKGGGDINSSSVKGPDCLSPAGGSLTVLDQGRFIEGISEVIRRYNEVEQGGFTADNGKDFVFKANQAGVNPLILMGQALTESSLGRQAIVCDDGTKTYNSFGRTASASQPRCFAGDRYWYIYSSFAESILPQAQYVFDRYVSVPPEGRCSECSDGPLSFPEYLEIYSPAFENDQAQMTKNYTYTVDKLKEYGYGDTFSCGTGANNGASSTTTTIRNIPI